MRSQHCVMVVIKNNLYISKLNQASGRVTTSTNRLPMSKRALHLSTTHPTLTHLQPNPCEKEQKHKTKRVDLNYTFPKQMDCHNAEY